ncbi:hypothetical protein YA0089_26595 [Pseudomonas viridiflava]|uniref:hypothetical protein n=1 Tax=Pseudomonas viridiflava TaxID=33069 RepID=UPI0018E5F9E7|nr:hypothetical protein [Pseudomonas viridiflava]MBI6727187.1 hypothetical protein [Pseudomonas viridiflava]
MITSRIKRKVAMLLVLFITGLSISSISNADAIDDSIETTQEENPGEFQEEAFVGHGAITVAESLASKALDSIDGVDDKSYGTYRMVVLLNPMYIRAFSTAEHPSISITAQMPDQLRLTPVTMLNGIVSEVDAKPLSSQTDRCAGSYACAFIVNRNFAAESMSDEGVSFFVIPQRDTEKYIKGWGGIFKASKWGNAYRVENCKFRQRCDISFGNNVVGQVKIYQHSRGDEGRCTVQRGETDGAPSSYQWYVARRLVMFFRHDLIDGPVRRDLLPVTNSGSNTETQDKQARRMASALETRVHRLAYSMEGDNLDKALRVLSLDSQIEEMKYVSASLFWIAEQASENPVIKVKFRVPRFASVKSPKGIDLKKGKITQKKRTVDVEIPFDDLLGFLQDKYEQYATDQYRTEVRATAQILEADSRTCRD